MKNNILGYLFIVIVGICDNIHTAQDNVHNIQERARSKLIVSIVHNNAYTPCHLMKFVENHPEYINTPDSEIKNFLQGMTLAHFLIRHRRLDLLAMLTKRHEICSGQDLYGMSPFMELCSLKPDTLEETYLQEKLVRDILQLSNHGLYTAHPIYGISVYALVNYALPNQPIKNVLDEYYNRVRDAMYPKQQKS